MSATLFQPLTLHGTRFANRVWTSPMAQYSAQYGDGMPGDWHLVHYGAFAQGGFGLVMSEATAINPVGRITLHDVGLWSDLQVERWRKITDFVHSIRLPDPEGRPTPVKIGVQLSHAGRKGSSRRPFPHEEILTQERSSGWQTVGPSPVPYPGYLAPHELDRSAIGRITADFAAAARRAARAGFDVVEINAGQGYLLHQFFSPLSNKRIDAYGGNYSNRVRFLREVVSSVRMAWKGPLFVRLAATDWGIGGWDSNDAVSLSVLLRMDGVDIIDVTSGGNSLVEVPVRPGYQVPFSEQIRQFAGIHTVVSGLITEPQQAEAIVSKGHADAVMIGRAALRDPHWPQRSAHLLGLKAADAPYLPQQIRGAWPDSGIGTLRP